jgi:hypothetical protein
VAASLVQSLHGDWQRATEIFPRVVVSKANRVLVLFDQVLFLCEGFLEKRRDDIEIDIQKRRNHADVSDVLHQDTGAGAFELLVAASPIWITTASYLIALVALPLLCVSLAAYVSKRWSSLNDSTSANANRFAFALVPIGFGMWIAHYSFHFFTSWPTALPVMQRFAADRGWATLGALAWECACCQDVAAWIPQFEILMLDFGLLASLYVAFRIAESSAGSVRQGLRAMAPWGVLIIGLFAIGVWIVFQPMEMRGTLPLAG